MHLKRCVGLGLTLLGTLAFTSRLPVTAQAVQSVLSSLRAATQVSAPHISAPSPQVTVTASERSAGSRHEKAGCGCGETSQTNHRVPAAAPKSLALRRAKAIWQTMPLRFEPNVGQSAAPVKFLAHGNGYGLFLTGRDAILTLQPRSKKDSARATQLRMTLAGSASSASQITGAQPLRGKINYLRGSDPRKWHVNVPTYQQVRSHNVYPGIDLLYYGNGGRLEYDFVVAPGANPHAIQLAFAGSKRAQVLPNGALRLPVGGGSVGWQKPVAYQVVDGKRHAVPVRFASLSTHKVGFSLGRYDAHKPLVIDPVLVYSTYLGGAGDEESLAIALNTQGNNTFAYITGDVSDLAGSTNTFPTKNAEQTDFAGSFDAFVTEIDPSVAGANGLIYSTYLGGGDADIAQTIAVDGQGAAYVGGYTYSADFPTTAGALNTTATTDGNYADAFVAKLAADGASLVYSTFLGGELDDQVSGITVDGAGNAYVVGATASASFVPAPPPTAYMFQSDIGGDPNNETFDGFLVELNPAGSTALYSTYVGGSGANDALYAVAVDNMGLVYVTGTTDSDNLNTTTNSLQPTFNQNATAEAFVVAFDLTKNNTAAATYLSYLGGNGESYGNAIAVQPLSGGSSDGNIYVAGTTSSTGGTFPITTDTAEQPMLGGGYDGFLTVLNATSGDLVYSTFIGGAQDDFATSIALSPLGNGLLATVAGYTASHANTTFTPTTNAQQADNAGAAAAGTFDAFMAQIDPSASGTASLAYLSFLGGTGNELDQFHDPALNPPTGPGAGVAVDSDGSIYLAGGTAADTSTNANAVDDFPTTSANNGIVPFQSASGGGRDAFLAKVTFGLAVSAINLPATPCDSTTFRGTVTLTGVAPTGGAQIMLGTTDSSLATITDSTGKPTSNTLTIAAGQNSGTFYVTSKSVAQDTQVGITASYNGETKTQQITIKAGVLTGLLLNGSATPASVGNGATVTGTVQLSCPAPTGGKTINLSSTDSTIAAVPATVTVAAGAQTATFTATTGTVTTATDVTITASDPQTNTSFSVTITVRPSTVAFLSADPNPVCGGVTSTGTVKLDGVAPAGGITVSLSSNNAAVTVPATVTVPGGASSATFTITTTTVTDDTSVTLTATYNGTSVTTVLVVQPLQVTSLTFDPTTVKAGGTSTGTVTINCPAPAGGYTVTLSSSDTSVVTVPGSVTVAQGATSATFTATSKPVTAQSSAVVTATLNKHSKTATLSVSVVTVTSLDITPTSVNGGDTAIGTITLSEAPESDTVIGLTSSQPNVAPVPTQVTVTAGQTTGAFAIVTQATLTTQVATISTSFGKTQSRSATLTVRGTALQSLTINPTSVSGGGTATGTLVLNGPAPAGGVPITVTSDKSDASVPSTVTVPAGATQVVFTIKAASTSAGTTATIKASFGGVTQSGTLTITPLIGGTIKADYQLFSVPYDYPAASLDTMFLSGGSLLTGVKLAVYDPEQLQYLMTPTAPADHIRLGRGYWSRFASQTTLAFIGTPADTTKDFSIALEAGWNMIGDPFLSSVNVSDLQVQTGEFPVSFATATEEGDPIIGSTLYSYPGGTGANYIALGSTGKLQPGVGYWIFTYGRATLIFPHP